MFPKFKKNSSVFQRLALIFLAILYNSLTVYELLSYVVYKLKHGIRFLRGRWSGNLWHNLNRTPEHLAMVLSEPVIRYEDLAKLILWCYEADIKFVTLYEPKGSLKNSADELLHATEELARSKFTVNIHISSPDWPQELSLCAPLDRAPKEIHVHLAAAEDGRRAIVEAARKLYQVQNGVSIEKVNDMLKVTRDWPEPDLLIRCGGIDSHLGFLPWALRLTEFADLYSHHYLFPSEFQRHS